VIDECMGCGGKGGNVIIKPVRLVNCKVVACRLAVP